MTFDCVIFNGDTLGGSLWMKHIGETLKALGFSVSYKHIDSYSTSDYTIVQSEWEGKNVWNTAKRRIVLCDKDYEPKVTDFNLSQWFGKRNTTYFPHAWFPLYCETGRRIIEYPFFGTENPKRDLSRFDKTPVEVITGGWDEKDISYAYRNALVCPNVHTEEQRGRMINERTFQIIGSGGFMLLDENERAIELFDGIVPFATNEGFKSMLEFYGENMKAREKVKEKARLIIAEHTYKNRIEKILLPPIL